MNQLAVASAVQRAPALVVASGERAAYRFLEFFTAQIRNAHTRRAYGRAVADFLAFCTDIGVPALQEIEPLHVAAYVELVSRERSAPTAKQHLAAIQHLFDWLVIGQILPVNPATSVRGPKHVVARGKTPVLAPDEARRLLDCGAHKSRVSHRHRDPTRSEAYLVQNSGAKVCFGSDPTLASRLRRSWSVPPGRQSFAPPSRIPPLLCVNL